MKAKWKVKRFYVLAGGFFAIAILFYLTVSRPLVRMERSLDSEVEAAILKLIEAGHGMSKAEVQLKGARLENEIEAFEKIASDPSRTIQFPPEVEMMLGQPFQLIDFDGRKFVTIDNIRNRSSEEKVEMFKGWEQQFPEYTGQPPRRIWAQLTAMDQLMRTAIDAGVQKITSAEIVRHSDEEKASNSQNLRKLEIGEREIAVHMRLVGDMKAIHRLIMMLPLNGEELTAMDFETGPGEKSAFFLSRFILRKSSDERPDEVELDFVASGFLDGDPGLDVTFFE